jgi:hypothetical protein
VSRIEGNVPRLRAKSVHFVGYLPARQGRFQDRGYEAQLNRASALSLVINAIAVWNTRYFERAEAELIRQQGPLPEEVWQHLSPFQWSHIHLNGSYHFTGLDLTEDFRPLREYHGARSRLLAASHKSQNGTSNANDAQGEEDIASAIQLLFFIDEEEDL